MSKAEVAQVRQVVEAITAAIPIPPGVHRFTIGDRRRAVFVVQVEAHGRPSRIDPIEDSVLPFDGDSLDVDVRVATTSVGPLNEQVQ